MTEPVTAAGTGPAAAPAAGMNITEAAPKAGTPEFAAWVEKQGGKVTTTPAASTHTMPEGGLEKFFNKENGSYDWANHVKELNYRLEQNRKPAAAAPAAGAQAAPAVGADGQPASTEAAAQAAVTEAGLNWDTLEAKVGAAGTLDESDFAALEKAGVPRRVAENYLEAFTIARKAVAAEVDARAGEGGSAALMQWAAVNLTPAEKAEYNAVLQTKEWHVAVDALNDRRAKTIGTKPGVVVRGQNQAEPSAVAFKGEQEMFDAMGAKDDKGRVKYRIDPVYRASVDARILASNFNAASGTFAALK